MKKRTTWHQQLEPYTKLWGQLYFKLSRDTRAMSDAELNRFEQAAEQPTQTNCAFTTYGVADMVCEAIQVERCRRENERAYLRELTIRQKTIPQAFLQD